MRNGRENVRTKDEPPGNSNTVPFLRDDKFAIFGVNKASSNWRFPFNIFSMSSAFRSPVTLNTRYLRCLLRTKIMKERGGEGERERFRAENVHDLFTLAQWLTFQPPTDETSRRKCPDCRWCAHHQCTPCYLYKRVHDSDRASSNSPVHQRWPMAASGHRSDSIEFDRQFSLDSF